MENEIIIASKRVVSIKKYVSNESNYKLALCLIQNTILHTFSSTKFLFAESESYVQGFHDFMLTDLIPVFKNLLRDETIF